nr:ninja-family protein 1-like [Coffea arabica]
MAEKEQQKMKKSIVSSEDEEDAEKDISTSVTQIPTYASSSNTKGKGLITDDPAQENPLKRIKVHRDDFILEMIIEMLLRKMPMLTTTGSKPNGKETKGFLYKYHGNEGAVIVCVCHGHLFTPKEFVKHAGGGEVENPTRFIEFNIYPH